MQTLRQKPWLVAVATLVIGVAIGLGVSTVTSRSGHASAAANTAAATSHDSTKSDVLDPFSEMERMQADIDRAIRRATDSFRLAPGSDLLRRDLGFSSALDVRDRKDHFEISAYLPDTEASDVNVVTESDKTLQVTVSQKKEEKRDTANGRSSFSELGQYEQLVTLAEPIRSKDMKVERNGHEIVINVPKAKAS